MVGGSLTAVTVRVKGSEAVPPLESATVTVMMEERPD